MTRSPDATGATQAPSSAEPSPPAAAGVLAWSRDAGSRAPGEPTTANLIVEGPEGEPFVLDEGLVARTPPAWSPDGTSLAYLADGGLVVGTLDGRSSRIASCRPPACLGFGPPAWSPDGSAIAFGWSGERGDTLAVVDPDGTSERVVAELVVEGTPAWSPDGRLLAVPSAGRIVVLDAGDGSVTSSIGFPGDLGERLSWSPDGETFVVAGRSDGETGVFLVPVAEGAAPSLLTACPDTACVDLDPSWSPDGSRVVFTRGRCDVPGGDCFTGDLHALPPAGGEPVVVVGGPDLDCCGAWQPVPQG